MTDIIYNYLLVDIHVSAADYEGPYPGWFWQSSADLDGFPFPGQLATYGGGGFNIELGEFVTDWTGWWFVLTKDTKLFRVFHSDNKICLLNRKWVYAVLTIRDGAEYTATRFTAFYADYWTYSSLPTQILHFDPWIQGNLSSKYKVL